MIVRVYAHALAPPVHSKFVNLFTIRNWKGIVTELSVMGFMRCAERTRATRGSGRGYAISLASGARRRSQQSAKKASPQSVVHVQDLRNATDYLWHLSLESDGRATRFQQPYSSVYLARRTRSDAAVEIKYNECNHEESATRYISLHRNIVGSNGYTTSLMEDAVSVCTKPTAVRVHS